MSDIRAIEVESELEGLNYCSDYNYEVIDMMDTGYGYRIYIQDSSNCFKTDEEEQHFVDMGYPDTIIYKEYNNSYMYIADRQLCPTYTTFNINLAKLFTHNSAFEKKIGMNRHSNGNWKIRRIK